MHPRGTLLSRPPCEQQLYPFESGTGIGYFYVLKEIMKVQEVGPLRSLCWMDNNCFFNAAVHSLAGVKLWLDDFDPTLEVTDTDMDEDELPQSPTQQDDQDSDPGAADAN